jgi:hypothetical protein
MHVWCGERCHRCRLLQIDALSLAFSKLANDPLAVWARL